MAAGSSIEQRLARIEARQFIEDMLSRYALGGDSKNDPAIFASLFAEDAVWEAEGFGRYEGRDTITHTLAAFAQSHILWSFHYMVTPLIEFDDELRTARCRWYLWELATMQTDNGPRDTWLCGWYDSQLRRAGEIWLFTYVKLDLRLMGEAVPPWELKKPVGS